MTARTVKDITRSLQTLFSTNKPPLSLPSENRRILQSFIDEHDGEVSEEESLRANLELKSFWERYVVKSPQRLGAFVGVLKELRPVFVGSANILDWWQLAVKPVILGSGYKKLVQDDAREFAVGAMVFDDDDQNMRERAKVSKHLLNDLTDAYISHSGPVDDDDDHSGVAERAQVTQQIEDALIAFGRKRPRDLFHCVDDLVKAANTRLQALTLLSSFLRNETPHLYLVVNTPLLESILKCLMNDTSTTILSVALTSLIMLLPHIPGSLGPHVPRLFLIYSRLLCWEKFSDLSSEAQRKLVTDDRVSRGDNDEDGKENDPQDPGIDPTWDKARPADDSIEADTPELMTYFTYLYGLYPLNLMSYIRKPRRYLKNVEFPGADGFDLDQAVIRSRTEQFRQVHLIHPNFYNLTVEEELEDPKWPKTDPADVVGDCLALFVNPKASLNSPGPPPTGKLPSLPPVPPLSTPNFKVGEKLSPSASNASFRSGSSWRDTQSTVVSAASPDTYRPAPKQDVLQMDDATIPESLQPRIVEDKDISPVQTDINHLQRQITLLRNELNFEKWHKAQISAHVGQIMRRNVKEATVDAETLNLINANRALKKQLEQLKKAREATIKDSNLTRKQTNNLESHLTDRFNKFKAEQEIWQADADELRRLRLEMKQYRELLVATEARELNKSHQLELAQRDLEEMKNVRTELQDARHRIHGYEYREFEYESAIRQRDILQKEKEHLQVRIQQQEQDRERIRQAYANRMAELESQLMSSDPFARPTSHASSTDTQAIIQQAVAESQSKLLQLKKAHSRLLEKHTDLELEYQHVKGQLEDLQGYRLNRTLTPYTSDGRDFGLAGSDTHSWLQDVTDDYTMSSQANDQPFSRSDPSAQRLRTPVPTLPISPPLSQANVHGTAGLTFQSSVGRKESLVSRSSGQPAAFNQSAPLSTDEASSAFSGDSSGLKKEKIQPDSTVRVYGRGGAQNIKLKQKDNPKPAEDAAGKKTGGLKALRKLV